jgi:CBS domain-containing protein
VNVSDVMTRAVVSVAADTAIEEAAQLMVRHGVSGLPVLDAAGALVGIVTEGDLLRRVELGTEPPRHGWLTLLLAPARLARDYVASHARHVGEIMTHSVVTVDAAAPLSDVVALMDSLQIKRLPVLDGGRLAGIVSRADLLRALAGLLPAPSAPALASDADIRRLIVEECRAQPWLAKAHVEVLVRDGAVELRGVVMDVSYREALRVIAENVPGVRRVEDRLAVIDPITGSFLKEHDKYLF